MTYTQRDKYYEEPLAQQSAMWTDLYELTMAQTLFLEGRHEQQATFQAFIRKAPYNGSYLLTAGQNIISEWLDKNWKFTERDLHRLANKTVTDPDTGDKKKIFKPEFIEMLKNTELKINLDMMPEGEIAFAGEPIYKVSGPAWQCFLVESAILNTMNSQSNFATYASILNTVADGKPIAEFGLRRSQAVGGLEPSRGAYVGGASSSSNCLAETNYGIPTIGTMAHAYVMMHEDETTAFTEWAEHNPYLGVFLVDTYDTVNGVKRAIEICKEKGIKLSGIRLDSGDLAYLSEEARKLMDDAGFTSAKIVVSNDLDSTTIESLKQQNAPIDVYAVGTNLVTAKEQPALGGVYKIANVYDRSLTHDEIIAMKKAVKSGAVAPEDIRDKVRDLMKVSEQAIKMTLPGELDSIRYLKRDNKGELIFDSGTICAEWTADPLNDKGDTLVKKINSVRRDDNTITKEFNKGTMAYRPIKPMFVKGKLVGDIETVHEARARGMKSLAMLDATHKRRLNPHMFTVGVEESLLERQTKMASCLRKTGNSVLANKL